ncbi:hypothetical protein LCGC14_2500110 [marine sediment metagenome]|uniref:Uncharacterized protein n=1 Tax=marine sediment metagenome TaxID=412755 RepID=A0A0F9B219_9ZZZZ
MTEIVGDIVMPSELIAPYTTTMPMMSGAIIVSGAKLWFFNGTNPTLVTSA